MSERYQKMQDKIDKLESDNKKLSECVEFYADKENYTKLHDYKGLHYFEKIGPNPLQDNGDMARQTLKEIKGEW